MEQVTLNVIDGIIIICYLVRIIGYGFLKGKQQSSEDYFLAGHNLTGPIVGISLFTVNIGSSTLIGLTSDAFKANIVVYNYEWMVAVVLVIFAVFFIPFYLNSKVYTMPEFLERRYDGRTRYFFSIITIVGNVIIDTAAGLYAGNFILKIIFPELDSAIIITLLAIAAMSSSISATLNPASTLITMDFILKLKPNLSSKNLVTFGQIATVILVMLAAAWASQREKFSFLWEYLQLILGFIAHPVVSVYLLSLFWKKGNANRAFASLLGGLILSMILILSKVNHWFPVINDIHSLHTAPLLLLACLVINICLSLLSAPPSQEKIEKRTWTKAFFDSETQELNTLFWYKNYRNLAILLFMPLILGYFI